MFTSTHLQEGGIYTREQLATKFGIIDATIRTGIFQPAGHLSVWLFVTEKKTPDRTQYTDLLAGDVLHWDGQTEGRKDSLIIDHQQRGLELLLFYRVSKRQYQDYGFKYEGRVRYETHRGSRPTHFTLRRINTALESAERDIEAYSEEEATVTYTEGSRSRVLVNKYERDPALRAAAIKAHGLRCQCCGFSFAEVYGKHGEDYIEVHHLRPLASYDGAVQVDPVRDMAVVCANCHRMIHRKMDNLLTLDALRALVEANRQEC